METSTSQYRRYVDEGEEAVAGIGFFAPAVEEPTAEAPRPTTPNAPSPSIHSVSKQVVAAQPGGKGSRRKLAAILDPKKTAKKRIRNRATALKAEKPKEPELPTTRLVYNSNAFNRLLRSVVRNIGILNSAAAKAGAPLPQLGNACAIKAEPVEQSTLVESDEDESTRSFDDDDDAPTTMGSRGPTSFTKVVTYKRDKNGRLKPVPVFYPVAHQQQFAPPPLPFFGPVYSQQHQQHYYPSTAFGNQPQFQQQQQYQATPNWPPVAQ